MAKVCCSVPAFNQAPNLYHISNIGGYTMDAEYDFQPACVGKGVNVKCT